MRCATAKGVLVRAAGRALRGIRVRPEMKPLGSARQARLLLGKSGEGKMPPASFDYGQLSVSLALEESGIYGL